jgi:molybdate/tungstate transport system permease protein
MIGEPLAAFNIRFVDAVPGIIVAMLFLSAPFLVNSAREGFEGVDPRLENVARSLGATRWGAFRRISMPLCYRHILTGAVMTWARAISEFGAVVVIAYYPQVATTLIYTRFLSFGLDESRPIAVLLVLVCLAVFICLRVLLSTDRRRGRR